MARILIIEDNPENLELMRFLLDAFGHDARAAADGEQGLAVAEQELPDLVLCDIQMPRLDGYGFLARLRADDRLRSVPCIAVTALAMRDDKDKLMAAGFDGYISKPIEPETFVAEAQAFIRGQASPLPRTLPDTMELEAPGGHVAPFATVLMVDDIQNNREVVRETLIPFGYRVILAGDVAEALALARDAPPDLIVSDLDMPEDDGLSLLRAIRSDPRLANTPFVLLSSSLWPERDSLIAQGLGVTRFLERPIEPSELLREIMALLPPPSSGN